nr:immunoglobulin heavy chain junction region [Macaca mulatta]
CARLWNGLDSW